MYLQVVSSVRAGKSRLVIPPSAMVLIGIWKLDVQNIGRPNLQVKEHKFKLSSYQI
jgi:hypothetical protein